MTEQHTDQPKAPRPRRRRTLLDVERVLGRVLELAAERLDMEIAWVSEIDGAAYRLRALRGDGESFGLAEDDVLAFDGTYCAQVLAGTLPNAVPDVRGERRTCALPVTAATDCGAYVGVPIRLLGGEVYGTLCCLSHEAAADLDGKDVRFLELLASVAGEELHRERSALDERRERRARIHAALNGEGLDVVFQPIVDIAPRRVTGVEALTRFTRGPRSPATWFAQAAEIDVELGEELELTAIRRALEAVGGLPDGAYLSLNASPRTASGARLAALLADDALAGRVQLEITEQAPVEDYETLLAALEGLRGRGVRIAIDDAGAGYACLQHILRMAPDVIKLDMTLTRGIDTDPARAALAGSLVRFAGDVGARLIAEGVETAAELGQLESLGVRVVQGFLLARPGPLPIDYAALAAAP